MLSRREFLKLCLAGAGALVFSDLLSAEYGEALERLATPRPPVIYLETVTCTANILSILNATKPSFLKAMFDVIDLRADYTLMAAEGEEAWKVIERTAKERADEYILVVEGTPMTRAKGLYGVIAEVDKRPITAIEAVRKLAKHAKYVVTSGTCAAYGGPYAAHPNPSGARPVSAFTDRMIINVPGCPVHPDWMMGTLTHLILYGVPDLDQFNRPKMFFGRTVHDQCERRSDFENGVFAKDLGEGGCLYRVGCKGPVSFCDIPKRRWGDHLNWYISCNSPCIGCTEPVFPERMEPFLAHLTNVGTPAVNVTAETAAYLVAAATGLSIVGHFTGSLLTGRFTKGTATIMAEEQAKTVGSPTGPGGGETVMPGGKHTRPAPGNTAGPPAGVPAIEVPTPPGGVPLEPPKPPSPETRRRRIEKALERSLPTKETPVNQVSREKAGETQQEALAERPAHKRKVRRPTRLLGRGAGGDEREDELVDEREDGDDK